MDAIVFIVLQVFLERAGKLFTVSMFPLWDIVSIQFSLVRLNEQTNMLILLLVTTEKCSLVSN